MEKLSIEKDLFKLVGKTIKDIRKTWDGDDYVILFADDTYTHIEPKEPFRQWVSWGKYCMEEQLDIGIITQEQYDQFKQEKEKIKNEKKFERDMNEYNRIKETYNL